MWFALKTAVDIKRSSRAFVHDRLTLPFLHLETDYSTSDTEQLRVRLEAFFELMR